MKNEIAFILLALAASSAQAANVQPLTSSTSAYQYGMHLDIAEVISVTPPPNECTAYPATMVYIDHQGQTHQLSYSVAATCWGH